METDDATRKAARTAIKKIAGTYNVDIIDVLFATVKSVDMTKRTCTVEPISGRSDTIIEDVALSIDQNDGEIKKPSIDSTVGVAFSNNVSAFLFAWSDLDQIVWKGGNFDGLVMINPLVQKINALENLVNDLISKFNSHTHILTLTSGTGTAAVPANQEGTTINPITKKADLENTTMFHGNK